MNTRTNFSPIFLNFRKQKLKSYYHYSPPWQRQIGINVDKLYVLSPKKLNYRGTMWRVDIVRVLSKAIFTADKKLLLAT